MTEKDTSRLNIECRKKDKATWFQAARKEGKKLEQWVNDILNEAARRADLPPPKWMHGFSRRTSDALMMAKIYKPSELVERIEEDTLYNIENFGPRCVEEVLRWHDENTQQG